MSATSPLEPSRFLGHLLLLARTFRPAKYLRWPIEIIIAHSLPITLGKKCVDFLYSRFSSCMLWSGIRGTTWVCLAGQEMNGGLDCVPKSDATSEADGLHWHLEWSHMLRWRSDGPTANINKIIWRTKKHWKSFELEQVNIWKLWWFFSNVFVCCLCPCAFCSSPITCCSAGCLID